MSAVRINLVEDLDVADHPALLETALERFLYDLRERLPMFVVFDHPLDFPGHYVARMWTTLPEPKPVYFVVKSASIERVRELLEAVGMTHLAPQPGDDAAILETWI